MAEEFAVLNNARQSRVYYGRDEVQSYREGITYPDFLAAPVCGPMSIPAGTTGALLASTTYKAAVAAQNSTGPGPVSGVLSAATAADAANTHTARIPITQVVDAESYDIFLSTDAAPKWVGSITEAERAAGCVLTTSDTVIAGSIAGAVDVRKAGTGLACNQAPYTTTPIGRLIAGTEADIAIIDCAGFPKLEVKVSLAGIVPDAPRPATATLSAWVEDSAGDGSTFHLLSTHDFTFNGGASTPTSQTWVVDVYGGQVLVLCDAISGVNASLSIDVTAVGY